MAPAKRKRVVILGAAGRDFHDFNVVYRDDGRYEVVAFTAAQIPHIAGRTYPPILAGPLYPRGIPVVPESELDRLLVQWRVDEVVFAYSDVPHAEVMHRASHAVARGADFRLLGARATMLESDRPVVSVCAVRTGCGKSPTARRVARILRDEGLRVAVVRHPMPYGDLARQVAQRFAAPEDLDRADCTIEEREEYEPHLAAGFPVFAGVDTAGTLRLAEAEADILLWDGGNNDLPFVVPDLEIVLLDPHRPGDERGYFPGEANVRRADVLLVPKVDTAPAEAVEAVLRSAAKLNPRAKVVRAALPVSVERPEEIRGRRVLVVEDGPTLTHGGLASGAGAIAARRHGAAELVDPRPHAVRSLRRTYEEHPHIGPVLPAMGYGPDQRRDLAATIERTDADLVLLATPADLRRALGLTRPTLRVTYELEERGSPDLRDVLRPVLDRLRGVSLAGSRLDTEPRAC